MVDRQDDTSKDESGAWPQPGTAANRESKKMSATPMPLQSDDVPEKLRRTAGKGSPAGSRRIAMKVNGIAKRFGKTTALESIDLEVFDEEFVVLLGPSGCGKSTLLRVIAGIETPSDGSIEFMDEDITDVAPEDRNFAMVFQSFALYPHMTVYQNIAFPLRAKKMPKHVIRERVVEAAETLGLSELLDRKPHELSGGQRQRVALGRATVRSPRLFLMDEPLGSLDANLRIQMRAELKSLQRRLRTPLIYVTHDQDDALAMGDRVVVMSAGHIEQVGDVRTIYDRPETMFVARFVGRYPFNLIPGEIQASGDSHVSFATSEWRIQLERRRLHERDQVLARDGRIVLGVRPEALTLHVDEPDDRPSFPGEIVLVEPMGPEMWVHIKQEKQIIVARATTSDLWSLEDTCRIGLLPEDVRLFSEEIGADTTAKETESVPLIL